MSTLFAQSEAEMEASLEQRADYIPTDRLFDETASNSKLFKVVQKALLSRALNTIVGPRGCGKTHMMRHAWLTCQMDPSKPFAAYVSFNKYYRLEPLLVARTSPPDEFHAWTLALIVLGTYHSVSKPEFVLQLETEFELPKFILESLVTALERNQPLSQEEQQICKSVSISKVQGIVDRSAELLSRKRSILLLDDAALTLTPTYLIELLDIVRALKSATIAPKASVYPGTTEYSPRFHTGQDSIPIFVWLSVEDENYESDMDEIANIRISNLVSIPPEIKQLVRFASFGIPRAYLTMLQEYKENSKHNAQQTFNYVVEAHVNARLAEYRSLATKVPKFKSIIDVGELILYGMTRALKGVNADTPVIQLTIGIGKDEITSIIHRMFQLLIEAGLLFDANEVKHGTPERIYQRFIPHTALLLHNRAITSGAAGGSLRSLVEALNLRRAKHPIRRKLEKYLEDPTVIEKLGFSLPPCPKCTQPRVSEDQKFCINCGSQLIPVSTFETCLTMKVQDVPGLTQWQISKINSELPQLKTIRDYLAMQDPMAELLKVYRFGTHKSARIVDILQSYVDDFLS
jgi:hypothetical protein